MAEIIELHQNPQPKSPGEGPPIYRWKARVTYRSSEEKDGLLIVNHVVEELWQLDDIIEDGPHWGTIVNIHITNNAPIPGQSGPGFTIEKAELL